MTNDQFQISNESINHKLPIGHWNIGDCFVIWILTLDIAPQALNPCLPAGRPPSPFSFVVNNLCLFSPCIRNFLQIK
jgi:hypothetical protein